MIGTILAPVNGSAGDKAVLGSAYLAAQHFGSHIECLYVRPERTGMMAVDMGVPVLPPDVGFAMEEADTVCVAQAQHAFDEFCRHHNVALGESPSGPNGVTAGWREISGDVVNEIIRHARVNGLTVLGRAPESGMSQDQLDMILLGSGRPVLLAPRRRRRTFTATVAIAWKETAEAARAVTAAMPFLKLAKKVVVLSANEGSDSVAATIESVERLVRALRWGGIHAESLHLLTEAAGVAEQILDGASRESADLLVMGGYSHSRMHEMIFGGFTRRVLCDANLPVLLCH